MLLNNPLARRLIEWCASRADQAGLSRAALDAAPAIPTVYLLTASDGTTPLYVGQSHFLRKRLLAHNSDPEKAEAGWMGDILYFVPGIDSTDLRLEIEAHLILCLRPPLNKGLLLNTRGRRLTEIRWTRKRARRGAA